MLSITQYDRSLRKKRVQNVHDFINELNKQPLKKEVLVKVGKKFRFTNDQLAKVAGVTVRTYQRQRSSSTISLSAAENAVRLADVYKNGMIVFENDEQSFLNWLQTTVPSLNDKKPIDLISTVS